LNEPDGAETRECVQKGEYGRRGIEEGDKPAAFPVELVFSESKEEMNGNRLNKVAHDRAEREPGPGVGFSRRGKLERGANEPETEEP